MRERGLHLDSSERGVTEPTAAGMGALSTGVGAAAESVLNGSKTVDVLVGTWVGKLVGWLVGR